MRFGNFEVLTDSNGKNCLLGGGAFGKTYKARHIFLKRIVALKVLHDRYANDARARERFLREAQAAHELKHPHIAEVLDFGEADGSLYYAMEFCSGGDLEHYTKNAKGPVPPAVCLGFARQICKALAYAHERNFYHRDLKPPNVMLASSEGEPVLKLIDFGLVKMGVEDTEESSGLTMAGEVLGTPMFASPEQLREEDLDQRSDLFSLGMTLWYLLEGAPPVPGSALTVMAERLSHKSYDKLFSMRVPRAVRPVLSKLLEKDPQNRYQNADALLVALTEALAELEKETAAAKAPSGALTPTAATESVIEAAASPGLGEVMAHAGSSSTTVPKTETNLPATTESASTTQAEPAAKAPRLQLLKNLGYCVLGEARQAQDLSSDAEVVAVRLQDGLDSTATWPARLAGAAQTVPPRLTGDLPLVTQIHEDHPYAVCSSSGTIRLVQILQARGNLPFLEAAQVLSQIALVLDEARNSNRKHDLQLNQINLAPLVANPAESAPAYTLTPLQLDQWPPFLVCVPLRQGATSMPGHMEDDDPNATGMMTMRNSAADEFLDPNAAFGGLIYRLITGGEPRSAMYRSKNNYRPIPNLSREGNHLLASCLEGSFNDDTLSHLLEKMMRAEKSNLVPHTSSTRSNAGVLSSAAAMKSGAHSHEQPATATSTSPLKTSSPKSAEPSAGTPATPAVPTPTPQSAPQTKVPEPPPAVVAAVTPAAPPQPPPLAPPTPVAASVAPVEPKPPVPSPPVSVPPPEPPKAQVTPVKPASPLPPPAKEKAKDKEKEKQQPKPVATPKKPASTPVPPIVWLAAGASLLVLGAVVTVGIFAYQGWHTSKPEPAPTPPNTLVDLPAPPQPEVKKEEPPKPETKTPPPTTPPAAEKKPEPPPKPKPPRELVFTKRVFPATVRVKANGRSVQLTKNSLNQFVLNLSAFTDYPLSILISPPLGFAGESHLITDPKASTYEHEVVFKRAKSPITIPGNSDYDQAELTFLDYHDDERASFQGDEFSKPGVGTVSLRNGSATTEVPTGLYQIRLISKYQNVASVTLAAKHPVPKRAGTGELSAPAEGWGGHTFECNFQVEVDISGKKTKLYARRILTFDEDLSKGVLQDNWATEGRLPERQQSTIRDIKVDASGNLTALLPLEDPQHKDTTFDEIVELKRNAQGGVTFQCYPAANSANKTRDDYDVNGIAKKVR
ncbi:serine/threonine protein kinase [Roseimicrobium gellanilyticum]|uniref:Serine/threonine protein kinase n=2 Tax=Roseimicrobium gellanilyticum TaxID=748857 RepID=A0A366HJT7_9BACT|nr:serine/threonine protein kinase [Roseimicrobium gellanilyticum]